MMTKISKIRLCMINLQARINLTLNKKNQLLKINKRNLIEVTITFYCTLYIQHLLLIRFL